MKEDQELQPKVEQDSGRQLVGVNKKIFAARDQAWDRQAEAYEKRKWFSKPEKVYKPRREKSIARNNSEQFNEELKNINCENDEQRESRTKLRGNINRLLDVEKLPPPREAFVFSVIKNELNSRYYEASELQKMLDKIQQAQESGEKAYIELKDDGNEIVSHPKVLSRLKSIVSKKINSLDKAKTEDQNRRTEEGYESDKQYIVSSFDKSVKNIEAMEHNGGRHKELAKKLPDLQREFDLLLESKGNLNQARQVADLLRDIAYSTKRTFGFVETNSYSWTYKNSVERDDEPSNTKKTELNLKLDNLESEGIVSKKMIEILRFMIDNAVHMDIRTSHQGSM